MEESRKQINLNSSRCQKLGMEGGEIGGGENVRQKRR